MKKQLLAFILAVSALGQARAQAINVSISSNTYSQNFDGLAQSGTNNESNVMPANWYFAEAGDPTYANGKYLVKIQSPEPNIYSLGDDVSLNPNITNPNPGDRALGASISQNFMPVGQFGAKFKNTEMDSAINGMQISFKGETWYEPSLTQIDTLALYYSIDADSIGDTSATWVRLNANYKMQVSFNPDLLIIDNYNGNNMNNADMVTANISNMAIPANKEFYLMWKPRYSIGAQTGIGGIDDLNITFLFGSATIDTTDTTDTTITFVQNTPKAPLNATLYPNPTNDVVTVDINQVMADVKWFIMNSIGQRMDQGVLFRRGQSSLKSTLDVSKLPTGVYFLYLESDDGTLNTVRFIRQ